MKIVNKQLSKHDDLEPLPGVKLNIWNAIIPIGTLIVGALFAFYYSGYTTIMGGEDSAVIQIMKDSPASFNSNKRSIFKCRCISCIYSNQHYLQV